jgi:Uma2 family endonuclease
MGHNRGMASSAASASYSWNDFVALDDDDRRELIDGALVEVEVPSELHEHIVVRIASALTVWSDAGHGGRALASGYKIRISDRRGVMPDVQFFREGNASAREQQAGLVSGHPDVVVEIVSPSSRRFDRITKLQFCAQLAITEYWLIDPDDRTLERLVLRDGLYSVAQSLSDQEVFRPDTFEGLEIPLGRLWAS